MVFSFMVVNAHNTASSFQEALTEPFAKRTAIYNSGKNLYCLVASHSKIRTPSVAGTVWANDEEEAKSIFASAITPLISLSTKQEQLAEFKNLKERTSKSNTYELNDYC